MSIFLALHNHSQKHYQEFSAIAQKHGMQDTSLACMATFELGFQKGEEVVTLAEKAGKALAGVDDAILYGIQKNLHNHASKETVMKWMEKLAQNKEELKILEDVSATVMSDIANHLREIAVVLWQKSVYGNH